LFQTPVTAVNRTAPPPAGVPDEFRALYQDLDNTLRQANASYPIDRKLSLPLLAPSLYLAGSGYGPAAPDSRRWKDLLATLDAFQGMGMNGVSVMIAAPDLSLGDPAPLLGFYQRLAAEIHARGMKLYVEHFVNPPFSPHAFKDLKDTPQGRKEFLDLMEEEVTLIARQIRPDYLSLLTEPDTTMRWTRLAFSADELAKWVGAVATRLKGTNAIPGTLLGAGAGTWDSPEFVRKLALQRKLDYIDFHVYALKLGPEDEITKLIEAVHSIRQARPDMWITIGEAWLYKHAADEPKGMLSREAFFRDNFSFWSPLDQQFFRLLIGIAQKEKISVVAPYFSQYFFTYYSFGDEQSSKLPQWPASVPASWEKALGAIYRRELSPTGKALRTLLTDRE
jgi:hypothetical protein